MSAALLASISSQAKDQVGAFLPTVVGALLLLFVGFLVAWLVARIARKGLRAAGVDDLSDRWGVTQHLQRSGLGSSLSTVAGAAIRISLSLVVIFAALSLLGLAFLSDSLNAAVLAIPNVLIAGVLVLAGLVLGSFARQRVDRLTYQLDFPVPLGQVAQVTIIAIFAITAAAQIAVSTAILLVLVVVAVGGAVAMVALAFGLGGRAGAERRALRSQRLRARAADLGRGSQR